MGRLYTLYHIQLAQSFPSDLISDMVRILIPSIPDMHKLMQGMKEAVWARCGCFKACVLFGNCLKMFTENAISLHMALLPAHCILLHFHKPLPIVHDLLTIHSSINILYGIIGKRVPT